jgi:hypothetical protein
MVALTNVANVNDPLGIGKSCQGNIITTLTSLGFPGWQSTNRIDSNLGSIAQGSQGKYSSDCRVSTTANIFALILVINFANVNMAQDVYDYSSHLMY